MLNYQVLGFKAVQQQQQQFYFFYLNASTLAYALTNNQYSA